MKKILLLPIFGLLLTTGCVREKIAPEMRSGITMDRKAQRIGDSSLTLQLVGSRDKIAGQKEHITFRLKNEGPAPVTLPDWRTEALDNLVVECQVWFPGTEIPDDALWLTISEPPETSPTRYPLTLDPENLVTIDVPLDFIESLRISPGAERRYFIRARLQLDSAEAASPVAAFTVRNR
ncbi:MAG: hypothetical protein MJ016_07415 [Victivallaceae bacterium]|nr:hypothetical protein [Victivallaceae bacterium]